MTERLPLERPRDHGLRYSLRKNGLAASSWQESTEGPPRRYRSLAPDGDGALRAFEPAWTPFRDAVDAALSDHPSPDDLMPDQPEETT